MLHLIPFELGKIWRKRSFIISVCVLLALHIFLLWYTSLPDEETPPLSAYKKIQKNLSGKPEKEKENYIAGLKETIDGVCFVRDILAMREFQNDMGSVLTEQELQNHPGVFEKYYGQYQSGDYLKFTSSLEQETVFINKIYEEQKKVSGYGEYLCYIQENRNILSEISVFSSQSEDTFSSRNLQKSAEDYENLTNQNIRFTPSKGITSAMESIWVDFLLFLGIMLFVGNMITEEKNRKLFFITRSTKNGMMPSIMSKLAALLIHCIFLTILFYAVSLVFFVRSTGRFDLGAGLQSVASYTESSLSVSILEYILISVLTKAFVLFGLGAVLTIFCICSGAAVLPFLAGAGIIGVSEFLYYLIPPGSILSVIKYMNPAGLMKTENIYGGYLNFNLFGYPVSRMDLSLALIFLICIIGISGSLWFFCHMHSFEIKKLRISFSVPFRTHTNILCHEVYKILVTNRALLTVLLFAAFLIYKCFGHTYISSVSEQYYQSMMAELEGELTAQKESLVLSEKARYEEALQRIEQIDEMVSAGELNNDAADSLKIQADMTLAFYPAFRRIEEQYNNIKDSGGVFVYDTGYLYLFGIMENTFSIDFLILTIGIIFSVSGAVAMEYQSGLIFLISTTKEGKWKILLRKVLICGMLAILLSFLPIVCRVFRIASVYPMHSLGGAIQNIPHFAEFNVPLPIGCFVMLFVLSQIMAAAAAAILTMAISVWRKNQVQTIFFAFLFLSVPLILKLIGFEMAKWFSLYPLYGWTELL